MAANVVRCFVWLLWCHATLAVPVVHLFVSPNGSDHSDGKSLAGAFKTISKAVSLLKHSEYTGKSVYIELAAGYHDLDHTVHINNPVTSQLTIRALNHSEVHVTGGKRVASSEFKPVTDPAILSRLPQQARHHVRVVHLPDVGITSYPAITKYGGWYKRTATLEIFINGEPLSLARWPNEGFINIVKLLGGTNGTRFQYNATVNNPASWQHEDEVWAYGYWFWSWSDRAIPVQDLQASTQTVTLAHSPQFGMTTGHWGVQSSGWKEQGGYFKFINVLSELDKPGEYYLDRTTGNMYVWFPHGDNVKPSDIIYISQLTDCFIVGRGSGNVVFQDFTIEACRRIGINAVNVHNVQVLDMEVKNTGDWNVKIAGDSRNCQVARCLFHDGDGGVYMSGGKRTTLESSGNIVEDNEIVQFSREGGVGSHGIHVTGVGNIARYNHVHSGQYTGIMYNGNDNVMEYNHMHHVCINASDCGAYHTGRDWTQRGNLIRHNIVHHTLRLVPGADVRGVMLDDQASGTIITNNVFYENDVHVNIGGGRDNVVSGNVMYDAASYSMQVDGRGLNHDHDSDLVPRLHAMPYNSGLWTSRYPPLANFLSKHPEQPRGNVITKNLVYNRAGHPFIFGLSHNLDHLLYFNVTLTGIANGPGDFYDVTSGDFRLTCHAATWANRVNFVQALTPNDVGTRYAYGPTYKKAARHDITLTKPTSACPTTAPSTLTPVPAYLPDGSRPNDLVHVPNHGCWISESSCTDHPAAHFYEDKWGEAHENTSLSEAACLGRAVEQWIYCGSHSTDEIKAVYGPSGAMTVAGSGCYMAMYGCPARSGPADGHVVAGKLYEDKYAENAKNASFDEEACLSRALTEWKWCGSHINHPVTSLFRPTGSIRTAGFGCWIHAPMCPSNSSSTKMFYDAWGATNFNTDSIKEACFARASDVWQACRADSSHPVTAYFRPQAQSYTYPAPNDGLTQA